MCLKRSGERGATALRDAEKGQQCNAYHKTDDIVDSLAAKTVLCQGQRARYVPQFHVILPCIGP
ncbi:MAG: hypothetical protein DLM70_11695 [Chloroflexi bacterium]|nr:MAG: hypothetical protein DLM70_11695 [Chloroflexota bacterium]